MTRPEVKVFITGDATGFRKAAGEVEMSAGKLSGKLKTVFAGIGFAAVGRGLMNMANEFKDAALAANDFATASGLSVEEASRWQEVAGDVGVEAKTLATTLGRLSKSLGKDADKFKKYGVEIQRTADGQVDANKTFLAAVGVLQKIEDPFERAAVGAELFGRSWQDLAPLVEMGADGVAKALADVGDAQVFDESEIEKAKRFREVMDTFNDSVQGVKFATASALIPVVSTLATWLGQLDPKVVALGISVLAGAVAFGKIAFAMQGAGAAIGFLVANPWVAIIATIAAAVLLLAKRWDDVTRAANAAYEAQKRAGDFLGGLAYGPVKFINNALGGNLGKGSLQLGPAGEAYLAGRRALGGPVMGGAPYLVGERGPEVFVPSMSGTILPNGAGLTVNQYVTVQATNPYELNRALEREAAAAARARG